MVQRAYTHRGPFHTRAHFPSAVRDKYRAFVSWKGRHQRLFWLAIVPIVCLVVLIEVSAYIIDGPLRNTMEQRLNERLKGYTASLPRLSIHPLSLSVTLKGLTLHQIAHPNPPVLEIRNLTAGVHWRALLHGALVADFLIDRPQLHVDLTQLKTEVHSNVKEHARSWQAALESIYPLKINQFRLRGGNVVYVDKDPKRPLRLTQLYVLAENIRNVYSRDRTYPSTIQLQSTVFDNGKLRLDGHANFLQEPFAGFDTDIDLEHVELDRMRPVAEHANLQINKGILDAAGHLEYAPDVEDIHMKQVVINGTDVEYVHQPQTENAEQRRITMLEETAKDVANKPKTLVLVDLLKIEKSTLGYRDATQQPGYRLFFSDVNASIKNLSNQANKGMTGIQLTGKFVGSGDTKLDASFFPEAKTANMDVLLAIEGARMTEMSDLFKAYGNFDIKSGLFSLYAQLALKNGSIDGYIKPLFWDMQVYDARSDEDKSVFHKMYVGLVNGVADLLQNPQGAVATKATVSGRTDKPETSTWEIVLKLIQNAFFKAILPGFEKSIGG